jgi:hypothetical protein
MITVDREENGSHGLAAEAQARAGRTASRGLGWVGPDKAGALGPTRYSNTGSS